MIIEPECAALAAQKATSGQLKKLKELLDDLKIQCEQKESWVKAGLNSHHLIVDMTGNPYLMKTVNFIEDDLFKSRKYLFKKIILYVEMWQEHQNIYQAILEKDPERARNFMRIHIQHAAELYLA